MENTSKCSVQTEQILHRVLMSRSHTSCVSEAEKYQGALYKGVKKVCYIVPSHLGVVQILSLGGSSKNYH